MTDGESVVEEMKGRKCALLWRVYLRDGREGSLKSLKSGRRRAQTTLLPPLHSLASEILSKTHLYVMCVRILDRLHRVCLCKGIWSVSVSGLLRKVKMSSSPTNINSPEMLPSLAPLTSTVEWFPVQPHRIQTCRQLGTHISDAVSSSFTFLFDSLRDRHIKFLSFSFGQMVIESTSMMTIERRKECAVQPLFIPSKRLRLKLRIVRIGSKVLLRLHPHLSPSWGGLWVGYRRKAVAQVVVLLTSCKKHYREMRVLRNTWSRKRRMGNGSQPLKSISLPFNFLQSLTDAHRALGALFYLHLLLWKKEWKRPLQREMCWRKLWYVSFSLLAFFPFFVSSKICVRVGQEEEGNDEEDPLPLLTHREVPFFTPRSPVVPSSLFPSLKTESTVILSRSYLSG